MPKANPRKIVNAGARIGRAFSPKELLAVAAAVNAAKAKASASDLKTLNLALAKLRKGFDWKAQNATKGKNL
jgi:hypothetical protein